MLPTLVIEKIRTTLAFTLGDLCRWILWRPPAPKPRIPIAAGQRPSLGRAFARVSRAEEHLADFVRRVSRRGEEQLNAITYDMNPNDPQQVIVNKPQLPMDFSFSILVGEIIYNLRAALDYFVFELAALDSGCMIEGTQFPLEHKKRGFKWCVKQGWLDGINAVHVAAIERLQPYNGNDWTLALKHLSNPDKHVHLIPSQADHELTFHAVDRDHLDDVRDLPGPIRRTVASDGTEMYVKAVLTTQIQFPDGTPIIETLEEIKSQVTRVLETFKPEFEGE